MPIIIRDSTRPLATAADIAAVGIGLLDDRGTYDASVNTFPVAGGSGAAGAVLKGDLWTIAVAGTLGGAAVTVGDVLRAIIDTPGQTAANWVITENNLGYVPQNTTGTLALAGFSSITGTISGSNVSGGTLGATAGTNLTGTAAGLTAGNVTTNANLTGHVTSVGNAATLGSFTFAQLNAAVSDANLISDPAAALTTTKTGEFVFGLSVVLMPSANAMVNGTAYATTGKTIQSLSYSEGSADVPNRLAALTFDDLAAIVGNCTLQSLAGLVTLGLPVLVFIGGNFDPQILPSVVTFTAPALVAVVGNFSPSNFATNTNLTTNALIATGSYSPTNMPLLTTLSATSLTYVNGTYSPGTMAALVTLSKPSLAYIRAGFSISSMAALTTVNFPAMVIYGSTISIPSASCANVSSVVLGTVGTLKCIAGATITMSGLKLDVTSVNAILALLVSLDGTGGTTLWGTGKTLTINGGTNAAPTGQGITDKATLIARGATVTTN